MRQKTLLFFATAFMFLAIPVSGLAQGTYNDRDWRGGGYNGGRNNNYNSRYLRDSVNRIDRLSGQLKGDMDRALDRSRRNGSFREDRINELVYNFHEAAAQLNDRIDDGRNLNRGRQEAQRVLSLGSQLDRIIGRGRFSGSVESKWRQIRNDLQVVQRAYSYRY